jgi:hypothetical protein
MKVSHGAAQHHLRDLHRENLCILLQSLCWHRCAFSQFQKYADSRASCNCSLLIKLDVWCTSRGQAKCPVDLQPVSRQLSECTVLHKALCCSPACIRCSGCLSEGRPIQDGVYIAHFLTMRTDSSLLPTGCSIKIPSHVSLYSARLCLQPPRSLMPYMSGELAMMLKSSGESSACMVHGFPFQNETDPSCCESRAWDNATCIEYSVGLYGLYPQMRLHSD